MGLSKKTFVNFRNSTLTRLLQPFLDGKARVVFICCVGPSGILADYTRKTLELAACAKHIKYKANINFIRSQEFRSIKNDNHNVGYDESDGTQQVLGKRQNVECDKNVQQPRSRQTLVDDELTQMEQQWKSIKHDDKPAYSVFSSFQNAIKKANKMVFQKSKTALLNNTDELSVVSEGEFTNLNSDCDDSSFVTTKQKRNAEYEKNTETIDHMSGEVVNVSEDSSDDEVRSSYNTKSFENYGEQENDVFSYDSQNSSLHEKALSIISEHEVEDSSYDTGTVLRIGSDLNDKFDLSSQKASFSKYISDLKAESNSYEDLMEKDSNSQSNKIGKSKSDLDSTVSAKSRSKSEGIDVYNVIPPTHANEFHTETLNEISVTEPKKSKDMEIILSSSSCDDSRRRFISATYSEEKDSFDNYDTATRESSIVDKNKQSIDMHGTSKSSENDSTRDSFLQLHERVNKMKSEMKTLQQDGFIPDMIFGDETTPSTDPSILTDSSYDSSLASQQKSTSTRKSKRLSQLQIENKENRIRYEKRNFKLEQQEATLIFEDTMRDTLREREIILKRWEDLSLDFRSYRKKWAKVLYENGLVENEEFCNQ